MPIPISILIDDPCPLAHVYRYHLEHIHHELPLTKDGRQLLNTVPNEFLDRFCDVVQERDIAGKFSIVPSPAGLGDVVRGIEGYDPALTLAWIETAKRRLSSRFDFCSEGITHDRTLDLKTGRYLDVGESDWSQTQDRTTLTPYLIYQLDLLKKAGIDATGVTSPWVFAQDVEDEYIVSIVLAQYAVYRRTFSWYFLHMVYDQPAARPYVVLDRRMSDGARPRVVEVEDPDLPENAVLVSIPGNINDYWWQTINSPRTDEEWIESVTDKYLSADGRRGAIREVLDAGGWPVLVTHWQSLFSNGLETGLRSLDRLGQRVKGSLGGEVEWLTSMEMAKSVADHAPGPQNFA